MKPQDMKNAYKPKHYKAYIVHPDSAINSMGYITFPSGYEPKVIIDKLEKRQRAVGGNR
jgi:hypothetical protein